MQTELSLKDRSLINNDYYHGLADRWYEAVDDPIALLRAESRLRNPWIADRVAELVPRAPQDVDVLDVGCGAGFLSNFLGNTGYRVTGIDLSETSLEAARRRDPAGHVRYLTADAYALPFADASFDVVTCTDFLEHVSEPKRVLSEIARCLRPGGVFVFHTFNRNKLAELLVIKSLEWFVKNVPPGLHVVDLFIPPGELRAWIEDLGLRTIELRGVRPVICQRPILRLLFRGEIDPQFRFTWTRSLAVSYTGIARKPV